MQRGLCTVVSLSLIVSSLGGCASQAKPRVAGPQVYGYTLNQRLSADEFKALSDTGLETMSGLSIYELKAPAGAKLSLYLERTLWVDRVEKLSGPFEVASDCENAFKDESAQLQATIAEFNSRRARPGGAPRQVGDIYASQSTTPCERKGGRDTDAQSYRYRLAASLSTETAPVKHGLSEKVENAYMGMWMGVFTIVLLPFALVGAAVGAVTD
ncbi:hypothetical protein DNK59_01065 [Pseudomonas sp. TKO26]|uniref:hypothetical protein n=1 Tax=unclassified Pseudomonas TaxID=196821 RepID=UPI000D9A6414|nr:MULTISPECIES: hypothetical protein [unclassified Pseudomonas]PYY92169.1 hypothetical protein DNK62_01065 [Pseudomonas sp. TKO30]PYY94532.1 hypothetical protein DNK61_01065 [Pseudomonas sp. TKO29]PYY96405.1 hypothetical protein DNK59_01065 [Pseudomonas sp. TKO26]PYZ01997.1 hypothetical protein DNK60_01065 [Pseudomonas sp. TKO14]